MKRIKQKYGLCILTCIICLFTWSCSSQKKANMSKNKTKDISTGEGKYIISTPVVIKNFVKKNGAVTKHQEIYLQRSVQDYYIKFCENSFYRRYRRKIWQRVS